MKSLYLRIYATVVVVLLLFALVSGWIVERHLDDERTRNEQVASDRLGAWAELLGNSLPAADTSVEVQLAALRDWSQRLRVPLALDDARGQRIGASESFERRMLDGVRPFSFKLDDGRTLLTMRPGLRQGGGRRGGPGGEARAGGDEARGPEARRAGPEARRAGREAKSAAAGGRRRRGRCCCPECRAVPGWRSSWSSSFSPSPPAPIRWCAA